MATTLAVPTTAPKFSIYIDSPESSPLKPRAPSTSASSRRPILRSRSTSCVNTPTTSWLTCPDKENMHPLTGARSSSIEPSEKTKKRKTSVLETKLYDPPTSKKLKDTKTSKSVSAPLSSSSNKRRAASVPLPDNDVPDSAGQTPSESSSTQPKKTAKRTASSRKVSALPKVDEETEESTTQPTTTPQSELQSEIDSKCYDLTVSPLADVSEAYDAAPLDTAQDVASSEAKPARKSIKLEGSAKRKSAAPGTRPRVARSVSMPASFGMAAFEPLTAFAMPESRLTPARSTSSEDTLVDIYASSCVSPVDMEFKLEAFADVAQPVVNEALSLSTMDTPERAKLATMISFGGVEPMGMGSISAEPVSAVGTIFGSF